MQHGRHAEDEPAARNLGTTEDPRSMRPRRAQWTELMRHAFGYELLSCPRCGGKMKLLACIVDRASIRKILTHRFADQTGPLANWPFMPPIRSAADGVSRGDGDVTVA